jgi:ArsR family transcriptional regulator
MEPASLLKALADPTRLRILHVLGHAETCVGDLVAILGVTQPTASRHLGRLRRTGLVAVREQGRWAHYSLAPARSAFHRRLLGCLSSCDEPEFARDLARAESLRRTGGCCPAKR